MKISTKFFKCVQQFKYFGKTLTNQNFIHEEIKIRLLSFAAESFIFQIAIQITKIEICTTIILEPMKDRVTGEWERIINDEVRALSHQQILFG